MPDEKDEKSKPAGNNNSSNDNNGQEPLHLHNPLKGGEEMDITQEDIDNEQKLKEAQTERD
jgi:hypothetical protein